ncbi:carbohydrate ABC transporter permease [Microbacterium aurantiacum]|uniref:carbohydrate ABC transporter permease n=1 Tax=Microbacterium aurantiacum TaxID=162393 RepID=UPI003D753E94
MTLSTTTVIQQESRRAGGAASKARRSSRRQPDIQPDEVPLRKHPLRVFIIVAISFMVIITQVPFLITIWYSLQRWNLTQPGNRAFVGFENYATVFTIGSFGPAIVNSVVITLVALAIVLIGGLALAAMVNGKFPSRGAARTMLFIPFLVPAAASALMWKNSMLHPTFGLINGILGFFGVAPIDWTSQQPLLSVIVVSAWQWVPFAMVILLAGLQSQDESVLEAARLDGANRGQVFRYITLPHLRPYIEIAGLLSAIFISQLIDPIVLMTQGGPGNATTTIPYLLYNTAFRGFDVGLSSAMGVLIVIVTIPIALVVLRLFTRSFQSGGGR